MIDTLKSRYFLNGLIERGSAYFFDDGFPKNPSIAVAASDCLNVIEKLERELAAANKRADEAEAFLSTVIDFLRFAPLESGICECGDSIEGHGNAMDCGHSPVDSGAYHIGKLIEKYEAMRHD